jgi:hypothetical protein
VSTNQIPTLLERMSAKTQTKAIVYGLHCCATIRASAENREQENVQTIVLAFIGGDVAFVG